MTGLRPRASAIVLALVFVAGSFLFPCADALAYHRIGADQGIGQPHYEPAGTTCGHADRCLLGAVAPALRLAPPLGLLDRAAPVLPIASFHPPASSFPGVGPHPLPQPRAPPVPAA